MRYRQPRPADDSKEKQKEREHSMKPFTFQNPVIDFLNRNVLGRNTQIGTTPLSNVSESVGIEQLLNVPRGVTVH